MGAANVPGHRRYLGLVVVIFVLASVACGHNRVQRLPDLEGTAIQVHAVTVVEPGVACGAIAFLEEGKFRQAVGNCVEGSLAGPMAMLGKLGGALAGMLFIVSPHQMEQERNGRYARERDAR